MKSASLAFPARAGSLLQQPASVRRLPPSRSQQWPFCTCVLGPCCMEAAARRREWNRERSPMIRSGFLEDWRPKRGWQSTWTLAWLPFSQGQRCSSWGIGTGSEEAACSGKRFAHSPSTSASFLACCHWRTGPRPLPVGTAWLACASSLRRTVLSILEVSVIKILLLKMFN